MFGDIKWNISGSLHFGWIWCMLWCSLSVFRPQKDLERWVSQTFLLTFLYLVPFLRFCFTDDTLVLWFRWFSFFCFSSLCFSSTFKACFSPDLAEFIQRALKPSDQSVWRPVTLLQRVHRPFSEHGLMGNSAVFCCGWGRTKRTTWFLFEAVPFASVTCYNILFTVSLPKTDFISKFKIQKNTNVSKDGNIMLSHYIH